MKIILRPEHEQLVTRAMDSGAYQSPDDVVGRALELLQSEDAWLRENKTEIQNKIERALDQFERGECYSAEESRAGMAKRKADWLAERQGR